MMFTVKLMMSSKCCICQKRCRNVADVLSLGWEQDYLKLLTISPFCTGTQ